MSIKKAASNSTTVKDNSVNMVTTTLETFNNSEFGSLRSVLIDNEPWFVGKDVTEALGYSNASKALIDHVDNEDKLNNESLSSLGQRGGWLINESGLYSLILSSKLPRAKQYKHWVTAEVLPSIRKKGYYVDKSIVKNDLSTVSGEDILMVMMNMSVVGKEFTNNLVNSLDNKFEKYISAVDDRVEKHFNIVNKQLECIMESNKGLREGYNVVKDGYKDIHTSLVESSKSRDAILKSNVALQDGYKSSEDRINRLEAMFSNLMQKYDVNIATQNVVVDKKETNPKLVNTMSEDEVENWRRTFINAIDKICRYFGRVDEKGEIPTGMWNRTLREIYDVVRNTEPDFDALHREYKLIKNYTGNTSKIYMISESDHLRPIVKDAAQKLVDAHTSKLFQKNQEKTTKDKVASNNVNKSKRKVKSKDLTETPENIRNLFSKIVDTSNRGKFIHAAGLVYDELEKRTGVDLEKLASNYAKQMGFARCTKAYYLGKNEKLLSILSNIIDEKCE